MKVGIISMQRVCNNGSFLQAYGLKKLIESLGHEVVFVDYHVGNALSASSKDKFKFLFLRIRNAFINLFSDFPAFRFVLPSNMRNIATKRDVYRHKVLPLMGISDKKDYNTKVDAIVIGSDEVFNCTQINPEVGFSPELFGHAANTNKIISYAASFGNTTYQKLKDFEKVDEIKSYFNNFNSISVRDKNSFEIVEKLTGTKPELNLDPVLMYDFMPTIENKETRENYIIVYAYRARITEKEANDIKAFAKKGGKKLISVSGEMDWCDEHFKGNPFEVLDLFRHADFAITDTFHGTIFSIINRIKFVTLIRKSKGSSYGNQEKLQDLLNRLGLQARSYSNEEQDLNTCLSAEINYGNVFDVINKERIHTLEYLKKQLS